MDKDEALRLALEALEGLINKTSGQAIYSFMETERRIAMSACVGIKEVLAQEQDDGMCQACEANQCTAKHGCVALDNPSQREWVGLTDEEIKSEAKYFCNGWYLENPERLVLLVKTIQAKLREQNT